jgi:hypothetical protein
MSVISLIDSLYSDLELTTNAVRTKTGLRKAKVRYNLQGKNAALQAFLNETTLEKTSDNNFIPIYLKDLYLYRTAYYQTKKSANKTWNYATEYDQTSNWIYSVWNYNNPDYGRSISSYIFPNDKISEQTVKTLDMKYEYESINRPERYDFEYRFPSSLASATSITNLSYSYNAYALSIHKKISSRFCMNNNLGFTGTKEERELIFKILSLLTTIRKKEILTALNTKDDTTIVTEILQLQDDIMCPLELTAIIMYALLLTRHTLIISGESGRISSFILNGNAQYTYNETGLYSSIVNDGTGTGSSDISTSVSYTKENTDYLDTNILFFGTTDGKIESYNYENMTWYYASSLLGISNNKTLFGTSYSIIKLLVYNTTLIIVTNKGIASYSLDNTDFVFPDGSIKLVDGTIKTRTLTSTDIYCITNQILSTYDITDAILYNTSLLVSDANGNMASYSFTTGGWTTYLGANLNTLVGPGYYINSTISNKQISISSLNITTCVNPISVKTTLDYLFMGYNDGSVASYSFSDNVWFLASGAVYPTMLLILCEDFIVMVISYLMKKL